MEHYFTNNENAISNEKEFQVNCLGKTYKFVTDNGVFSKGELDFASKLLIETFLDTNPVGNVLDVGCGYGALGVIIGSQLPNSEIHMVDVNLRALDLSKRNAKLNKVGNVQVYASNCYEGVEVKFSNIISNPPIRAGKKTVHRILIEAIEYLEESGTLTIVIGKQHGAESAKKKMAEVFGNAEMIERKKGFWIIQSIKGKE